MIALNKTDAAEARTTDEIKVLNSNELQHAIPPVPFMQGARG